VRLGGRPSSPQAFRPPFLQLQQARTAATALLIHLRRRHMPVLQRMILVTLIRPKLMPLVIRTTLESDFVHHQRARVRPPYLPQPTPSYIPVDSTSFLTAHRPPIHHSSSPRTTQHRLRLGLQKLTNSYNPDRIHLRAQPRVSPR